MKKKKKFVTKHTASPQILKKKNNGWQAHGKPTDGSKPNNPQILKKKKKKPNILKLDRASNTSHFTLHRRNNQPRELIPQRTGRYDQNFSCRWLDRNRNQVDSYRPKYRGVSACIGYFGGFRCFSLVTSFRTGTN